MKIFNRLKVNQTIIGHGNTCIADNDQRMQDLLAHGFEVLRAHSAPQSPRIQARLSGRPVPPLVSSCYIELLREGHYWTLAVDGAEVLQHASRAACLRMLELITAPEAEEAEL